MDHNIDLNYRRKICPLYSLQSHCPCSLINKLPLKLTVSMLFFFLILSIYSPIGIFMLLSSWGQLMILTSVNPYLLK